MLLTHITELLQRVWDLLESGWAWVRRIWRNIVEEVAALFASPVVEKAAAAAARSGAAVASTPASERSEPSLRNDQPNPLRTPVPVEAPTKQESVRASDSFKIGMVAAPPAASPVSSATAVTTQTSAGPTEITKQASNAAAKRPDENDTSDETALARMLASDDSPREVQFVRGWIAVQHQRARKVSMFELLTRGLGYGPRNRKAQGKLNVYASTDQLPSDTARAIAHSLLTDAVEPSAVIRMHKPGQLIERGKELTDAQLLRRQADIKEGIYGRIQGTEWLLLSPDAPAVAPRKGQSATEAIDALPSVPVLEPAAQPKRAAA